jgi:tRNA threonylcarbamoyladenosine biosynthesis protein TsaE
MEQNFTICSPQELTNVSSALAKLMQETHKRVILLNGNLGTGKTTFVKEFVSSKNVDVEVDSPTFSIVNDYDLGSEIIHHFDLYRTNTIEEIEDFGFWDYIDSSNICFIEWPDKIADLLPQNQVITVDIKLSLNQCREFTFYY